MPERQGQVTTANATLYLNRLCKHFSHKIPARWDDQQGELDFGIGRCRLSARANELAIVCEAGDAAALQDIADTVESHLARFGTREALGLCWI